MCTRALAVAVLTLFAVVIVVSTSSCVEFSLDITLCPGFTNACLCTLNQSCSARSSLSSALHVAPSSFNRHGTCAGVCRQSIAGMCPGSATCLFDSGPCVPGPQCNPPDYGTRNFTLKHQGFDGHPGVLVYTPSTFNASIQELNLVLFIHGFHNCIQNCVLPPQHACTCTKQGSIDTAYGLIDSFEAAARHSLVVGDGGVSQSLFLAIEVAYDVASSNPGNWSQSGMLALFLQELLGQDNMGKYIGARGLEDLLRVRIFSHSGGYNVLGAFGSVGGVKAVLELTLLDSLYGDFPAFDSFVQNNLQYFGSNRTQYRFHSIYTDNAGTRANNQDMAARVSIMLSQIQHPEWLYSDDTLNPADPAMLASHPIVFKRVNLTHDASCRVFFNTFLTTVM